MTTEDLHRQIERHFLGENWFYDRRKNYYKNLRKPADRIVGIPALGQAIMAISLGRPDDARARPTSLLNDDDDYAAVFSPDLALSVYLWAAQLQKHVDALLANDQRASEPSVKTNTRFYVSSYIATRLLGVRVYSPAQLTALSASQPDVSQASVAAALGVVLEELSLLATEKGWQPERASKSSALTQRVLTRALRDA